jgi:hypothetical protein
LVVDGQDLRPEAGGKRLAFLDGEVPDRPHLTALLYQWQGELFKPSAEELESAKKAVDEGAAWTAAQGKPENEVGHYSQMTAAGPFKSTGDLDVRWVVNHYELKFAKGGVTGVGLKAEDSGYHMIGGLGTGEYTVGLFRFDEKAGGYTGLWLNPGGKEAPRKDIWKTVVAAEGTFGSARGKIALDESIGSLNGDGKVHPVKTDQGASGFAYRFGNDAVGHGFVFVLGANVAVFDFKSDGGNLVGDYNGGSELTGYLTLSK